MVQGPIPELEVAALVSIQDTAKLLAERFERQPKDA
jgi:hypothetical protein